MLIATGFRADIINIWQVILYHFLPQTKMIICITAQCFVTMLHTVIVNLQVLALLKAVMVSQHMVLGVVELLLVIATLSNVGLIGRI